MSISVLILTLDEEINLPGCLGSVAWSDDIVVFDSYSSDRSVEIAEENGARVVQRKFDNYAAQRNAALNDVEYKNPWIMMIDADELVTVELKDEIEKTIAQPDSDITLYRIKRKDMFMGKWLKRSIRYPIWFGRLFKAGTVRVERETNEEYYTDGKIGYLKEHFIHYPLNKGIDYWFERHNRYSSMEAEALIREIGDKINYKMLFSSDPVLRKKIYKQMVHRLPLRSFWVFMYFMVVRRGFMDGRAGFTYCFLRGIYEYMIDIKVKELRRRKKGLSV